MYRDQGFVIIVSFNVNILLWQLNIIEVYLLYSILYFYLYFHFIYFVLYYIHIKIKIIDLDAESTLVVVVSKTMTTAETMLNARTVRDWMLTSIKGASSVDIIRQQFIACR